jgi:Zn-dependent peptidase ImmA (M78 family)
MKLLAAKARSLRIGWNKRPLTEDDFHRLRKRLKVALVEVESEDMDWKGFYTLAFGKIPTIILNARLRGIERLRVLWHEMGHHLFHAPATCFFSCNSIDKAEVEANAFANIALLPESMMERMLTWDLYGEDCLPAEIVRERILLFASYRL